MNNILHSLHKIFHLNLIPMNKTPNRVNRLLFSLILNLHFVINEWYCRLSSVLYHGVRDVAVFFFGEAIRVHLRDFDPQLGMTQLGLSDLGGRLHFQAQFFTDGLPFVVFSGKSCAYIYIWQ